MQKPCERSNYLAALARWRERDAQKKRNIFIRYGKRVNNQLPLLKHCKISERHSHLAYSLKYSSEQRRQKSCPKDKSNTFNSRYTPNSTTNLPIWCLCRAYRTGCSVLLSEWSCVGGYALSQASGLQQWTFWSLERPAPTTLSSFALGITYHCYLVLSAIKPSTHFWCTRRPGL